MKTEESVNTRFMTNSIVQYLEVDGNEIVLRQIDRGEVEYEVSLNGREILHTDDMSAALLVFDACYDTLQTLKIQRRAK